MKKLHLVILILSIIIGSCRKNDIPGDPSNSDTLYPKPYLPIYPGSSWNYLRSSDSSTVTMTAGAYTLQSADYSNYHSKYYWVPSWNGVPHFGYGFVATFSGTNGSYKAMAYELKESNTEHYWWYKYYASDPRVNNNGSLSRYVQDTGLTITVGANTYQHVIQIDENMYCCGYNGSYFFAKDVGLIEQYSRSGNTFGPMDTLRLTSYFINH